MYEQICSYENCKTAILSAAKGKKSRRVVKRVHCHLNQYAYNLSKMLTEEKYRLSPYRAVIIQDGPSRKEREIQVPAFWPDQCIHHALMNILCPRITRSSYYWSCGSMPNRGFTRGIRGVERATMQDTKNAKYCAKLDISKFYSSIPHDRLKVGFRRHIKDAKMLRLIDTVIDSYTDGLPIGNYTSAWFANFYLMPLDNFIKASEEVGGLGIKHYVRYVDDMVLFSGNKKRLHAALRRLMAFANDVLGVRIKGNWQVFPVKRDRRMRGKRGGRSVDFLGFCFCLGYTTLRKRNALTLMRKSRKLQKRIALNQPISFRAASGFISRIGQIKHCDSLGLRKKYVDVLSLKILKGVIRRESKRRQCTSGGVLYGASAG